MILDINTVMLYMVIADIDERIDKIWFMVHSLPNILRAARWDGGGAW